MATKIITALVDGVVQQIEVEDIVSEEQVTIEDRLNVLENKKASTYTTISLPVSAWTGNLAPYSQVVSISGVTANTKVDIKPSATQTAELQDKDIAFVAENENGVVTVYSIHCKPEADYEVQAVLTEVTSL